MDLDLSADQVDLRDGIRALLAGRFDSDRVRAGFDRSAWDELAAAGVFGLRADGFGWADAAVVFEELGRAVVPGPLVAAVLAGTRPDAPAGSGSDSGEGLGIVGLLQRGAERDAERGGGAAAEGGHVVEHLDAIDTLLVLDADAVRTVPAAEITGTASGWPLDPLTPVHRVDALPAGEVLAGADPAEWRRVGAVLTAAFQLGLAQGCIDLAVPYAQGREQFGRPVGGFQAVKHLLADMVVRTEVARAAVYAAGAHLDDPSLPGLDRSVHGAKALAGEAAVVNGRAATQVHGGMGFTWEVDVHLYLKRAWVLDNHFGSSAHHEDTLAATMRR